MPRGKPAYLRHPSGRGFSKIGGRFLYFGPYGERESRERYNRALAEWIAAGSPRAWAGPRSGTGPASAGILVAELVAAYRRHAATYYTKDGKATGEVAVIRAAMDRLLLAHASTPAADFGPRALAALRDSLGTSDLSRSTANKYLDRVRRMYRWAVSEEMVPASTYHALQTVPGLRKGRVATREADEVVPVPIEHVDATLPHIHASAATMVRLQILSGMRPGEVVLLRTSDIQRSGNVWTYRPRRHKTQHHERSRVVYLGPRAIELLRPALRPDLDEPLFLHARGRPWTEPAYRRHITRACAVAKLADGSPVPTWTPRQLRKTFATRARAASTLDAVQVLLGHASADTSEIYAEADARKAIEIIERIG